MMKSKKTIRTVIIIVVVVLLWGISVYAASTYGTQSDPLVTLSYLTDKLTPDLMTTVNSNISSAVSGVESAVSSGGMTTNYELVSVPNGKTLTGNTGCEVLLRSGTMNASTDGFVDSTGGDNLANGAALTQNHLYMMTGANSVTATSEATVLVRGSYTIG